MKFQASMKCPDALDRAIEEAAKDIPNGGRDEAIASAKKICEKWFKYGEYLTVEVDTEAKTCNVI